MQPNLGVVRFYFERPPDVLTAGIVLIRRVSILPPKAGSSRISRPGGACLSLLSSFMTGLLLTLADQKVVIFYLGFLPEFINLAGISYLGGHRDGDHHRRGRKCQARLCLAESIAVETGPLALNVLDIEFHRSIYRAAHNPFLEPMLDQYLSLSVRLWYYCATGSRPVHPAGVSPAGRGGDRPSQCRECQPRHRRVPASIIGRSSSGHVKARGRLYEIAPAFTTTASGG